jgi:hypothetical protein
MKRGQGTFEYVLLLGGVLLIVVLAIVVLQNTAQDAFKGAGEQQCSARLLTDLSCRFANGSFNSCGQLPASDFATGGKYSGCTQPIQSGCGTAGLPSAGNVLCGQPPIQ